MDGEWLQTCRDSCVMALSGNRSGYQRSRLRSQNSLDWRKVPEEIGFYSEEMVTETGLLVPVCEWASHGV